MALASFLLLHYSLTLKTITIYYQIHHALILDIQISMIQIIQFLIWGHSTIINKYLEIYNPTSTSISLNGYALAIVQNAPATPGQHENWLTFTAGAEVSAKSVYVIAHSSADPQILGVADQVSGSISFNGNDAYKLVKGIEASYTVVDSIGDFLGDPGTAWDVAGVSDATADHTLVRKSPILKGNSDWNASRGTNATNSEWVVNSDQDWSNLGFHRFELIATSSNTSLVQVSVSKNLLTLDFQPDQNGTV